MLYEFLILIIIIISFVVFKTTFQIRQFKFLHMFKNNFNKKLKVTCLEKNITLHYILYTHFIVVIISKSSY